MGVYYMKKGIYWIGSHTLGYAFPINLKTAQLFEYTFAHMLDKNFES
jgi:hypothetical protein